MIVKRINIFKRYAKSWRPVTSARGDTHLEKVVRESWWLFGVIPLYVRDSVQTTNL